MLLTNDLLQALDPAAFVEDALGITLDPWQRDVLRSPSPRLLMACSRQAGKSTVAAGIGMHRAIYVPKSLVLLLSPSLRQSQELFRKCLDIFRGIAQPVPTEAESKLRLELENGSRVISLPGTEATVRGFSAVDTLLIDEAARVDDGLYMGIRPMLAVSQGRLIALTSPRGQRGWFWQAWSEGGDVWQRVKITAHDVPRISAAFLAEERQAMGDFFFRAEYLAEFTDVEDQVFRSDDITGAMSTEVRPLFGAVA